MKAPGQLRPDESYDYLTAFHEALLTWLPLVRDHPLGARKENLVAIESPHQVAVSAPVGLAPSIPRNRGAL